MRGRLLAGFATLSTLPALASGREGAGIADAVQVIVNVAFYVVAGFFAALGIGAVIGAALAMHLREPVMKGAGKGAFKVLVGCAIGVAALLGIGTLVIFGWLGYSLVFA